MPQNWRKYTKEFSSIKLGKLSRTSMALKQQTFRLQNSRNSLASIGSGFGAMERWLFPDVFGYRTRESKGSKREWFNHPLPFIFD
jgi:hypothetical protein